MNINITFLGAGYVGLVSSACFAKLGFNVVCADINASKISQLKNGTPPFYEPDLKQLIYKYSHNLSFTTDIVAACKASKYIFITVDTPQLENGESNLEFVYNAAKTIGESMDTQKVIIIKSTVPIGTSNVVNNIIKSNLKSNLQFEVVSNPEFLREGSAVSDFLYPDRIILGCKSDFAKNKMLEIYKTLDTQLIFMDNSSAELSKYACNSMLAARISFINEIANLSEKAGASIDDVVLALGSDHRIGPHFLKPGIGYGGSCFPKDIRSLISQAKELNVSHTSLTAIEQTNQLQPKIFCKKIINFFNGSLKNKVITIWGGAYKPNTSDIRVSPATEVMEYLLALGAHLNIYDPKACQNLKLKFNKSSVTFFNCRLSALKNSDGLAVVTEWDEFLNFKSIPNYIYPKVIFDGRNCLSKNTKNLYVHTTIAKKYSKNHSMTKNEIYTKNP